MFIDAQSISCPEGITTNTKLSGGRATPPTQQFHSAVKISKLILWMISKI